MYGGIVLVWLLCLVYYNPKLLGVLTGAEDLFTVSAYLAFIGLLNLFWLYGIYHCFFLVYKTVPRSYSPPESSTVSPRTAILYTTCNDFKREAVLSCINQNYRDFHVYLLDDSTDKKFNAMVDDIHSAYPDRTTVIRRQNRKGFKAGNLNNALRHYVTDYEYFAVVDADEIIPPDFLKKLIPYFQLDNYIAFVQANHQHNPNQPSKFAEDLSLGIAFHWNVYQPPRNNHGFVVFYGHGGVIRRDIWEQAGGFPEIVSEDLAFATRVRILGFRGHFVREVICYEDFPETYHQFRTRSEKWVKGACEYLHREFWPFLISPKVTFAEKMDVLMSCFSLFLPVTFLIFLFVANGILPMFMAEQHTVSVTLFGESYQLMPTYFLEPVFKDLWTLDFYLITLIGMFAPIFVYFGAVFSQPRKILTLLFKSAVPYISLIVVSTWAFVNYLFTRRADFVATGDKNVVVMAGDVHGTGVLGYMHTNHALLFHMEFWLGALMTYMSLMTMNFALLGISTCLMLSPFVSRYGWDDKTIAFLVTMPLFLVLLAVTGMGMGFLGLQGFSLYFLALHF